MNEVELFQTRIALIRAFLLNNDYEGVLLSRPENYAMATGGKRNYVYVASCVGANSLFVTKDGTAYFVGDNIEETRQSAEELGPLGCQVRKYLWFTDTAANVVRKEFPGRLVSDDGSLGADVHGDLAYLRALLTPMEIDKYRTLGKLAGEAMTAAVDQIQPGMLEGDVAALLRAEGAKRRCLMPVVLIAADDRIARFRHPLPTETPLLAPAPVERAVRGYVMVVGCFLKEGLVASMTRFKRVGEMPADIPDAYTRICAVDAVMQESSEPGKTMGDVFDACRKAYAAMGFPENEWHNHHQGGTTGYAGRTCKASPGSTFPILDTAWADHVKTLTGSPVEFGHAFAWNPSAVGVKSEDTFLLPARRLEGNRDRHTGLPRSRPRRVPGQADHRDEIGDLLMGRRILMP